MTSQSTAQSACIGSFVFYIAGMLLFMVGFSCPYWIHEETPAELRSGLWKTCTRGPTWPEWQCVHHDIMWTDGWFQTTVAFMIMGLIVAVPAGATRMYMPVSAGLEIIAGVFGVIAVCVYGPMVNGTLGWAYWVTVSASAVFIINGIILAVMTCVTGSCDMRRHLPCHNEVEPI